MRRIFVKSPLDPSVGGLEKEAKLVSEGTLHVVNFGSATDDYSATYTPYTGPGGAIPARRFRSILALRSFLEDELQIRRSSVEEALSELERTQRISIPMVRLTLREAKRLGLA